MDDSYLNVQSVTTRGVTTRDIAVISPADTHYDLSAASGAYQSVLAYGARPNSGEDDTANFHAALANNNYVTVPTGSYYISELVVPNDRTLVGSGNKTVLFCSGDTCVRLGIAARLCDLDVYYTGDNHTTSVGIVMQWSNMDRVNIPDGVSPATGVQIANTSTVTNSYIAGKVRAVAIGPGGTDSAISDCHIVTHGSGIFNEAHGVKLSDLAIVTTQGQGDAVDMNHTTRGNMTNISVTGGSGRVANVGAASHALRDGTLVLTGLPVCADDFVANAAGVHPGHLYRSASGVVRVHQEPMGGGGVVTPQDFGAVGDGVTDDTAAMNAALAHAIAHKQRFHLPHGHYFLSAADFATVTAPNDFRMTGEGSGSHLHFHQDTDVGYKVLFNLVHNDIEFKDFKVQWQVDAYTNNAHGPMVFNVGTSQNVHFHNLTFDMGVHAHQGARSHFSAIWVLHSFGASVATDFVIRGCRFVNNGWGFLKSNESTSVQHNWLFDGNSFEDVYSPQLTFNTPSGEITNFRVVNNNFKNMLAATIGASGYTHFGGVAGSATSRNFVFSNNTFSGSGEGLHFEEGVQNVVISGNVFDGVLVAVEMLDNAVGGTRLTPSKFTITGNTMSGTRQPGSRGVWVIWDSSGQAGGADIVVANNVIFGQERGISIDRKLPNRVMLCNNYIGECETGVLFPGNIPVSATGNVFYDCAQSIVHNGDSQPFFQKNYLVS